MSMTGLYGEPLELLKSSLEGLSTFAAFASVGTPAVHLYERLGDDDEPVAGEAWAVLSWKARGYSIQLVPGLQVSRTAELTLVRCTAKFTSAAKEAIISDVSGIIGQLIGLSALDGILTRVVLVNFAIDEATEPPTLGAVLNLHLEI